ncbi:MAG: outer membrane protein transport protein [Campylobacterota bacterium]|nr:outer membrane protein transport protein [Campylobacterota bacterium]
MKKIALLSLVTASVLMAGGYKIPETSLNAVALSAANIAHSHGADAAYYNPANMVFMEDKEQMEMDLMYIGLDPINYQGSTTTSLGLITNNVDIDAENETFFVPSLHYVSGKAGETRIGLSVVSPGGLSKRWDEEPGKTTSQEFTLEIIEVNPTVAIPVSDKVAVAFGFRILYTSGVVKSDGQLSPVPTHRATRDLTGDSFDFGYNLALAYKPTSDLDIGLTYRSQVNLTIEGKAELSENVMFGTYDGDGSVTVPLPASASLALAYTLPSKTTIEFVYERNMWSAYKELDFGYEGALSTPILTAAFDDPKTKDWKDTSAYRLGITQELDAVTLMAGAVYDESPVPEETLGFELPGSNSLSLSFGGRYQISKELDVGLAVLYSMRESRKVKNDSIDGEFTNSDVLLVSTGIGYKF